MRSSGAAVVLLTAAAMPPSIKSSKNVSFRLPLLPDDDEVGDISETDV